MKAIKRIIISLVVIVAILGVAARHGIGKWANNFNVCRSCNFDYSSFGRFLTDLSYRKLLSVKTDESDFKDSSNVALIVKECDINPNDVK